MYDQSVAVRRPFIVRMLLGIYTVAVTVHCWMKFSTIVPSI